MLKNYPDMTTPLNASNLNIETGSNDNGSYIKFPDGTMICYQNFSGNVDCSIAYGSGYYGYFNLSNIKPFPVSFVETPVISVTLMDNDLIGAVPYSPTKTTCSSIAMYIYGLNSKNKEITLNVLAIGKWK